ncbi:cell division protein ZapE [Aestuariirhabdus litorea]|uniref:Cell division protein ZapE n=1 Tax=Aestuariirhabdus litorea TaxID=2528527 RepID=A0A3P3VRV7_9GAMM|nr:cell division protein ZapE [Aestuariirhabdus litorea]RRJ85522.1 cell division protein ZapE [Aestuariirhabdus litorea]RWW98590.1 cell division protein ZapE [Endozoicomonadaceae bacterium GTF-13]
MTPLERYQQDLQREGFSHDASQEQAVRHLQRLYDDLVAQTAKPGKRQLIKGLLKKKRPEPLKGLYFWGGVGRGKTYLVDTFYDSLPFEQKMRTHFHRFMRRVHHELTDLKGEKNPLIIIARRFAGEARVICFDEFFVTDITDAMILAGLFSELFNLGVTLVATSNIVPDDLYKDGLQRAKFLPAIDLIKQHTTVVNVDSGIDYRLRVLEQAEIYHFPLGEAAQDSLQQSFEQLTPDVEHVHRGEVLQIEGRDILSVQVCDDVAWFTFTELCDGPRSQNDYIELGRIFHAILLSDVPQMDGSKDDQARRFVNLVDEFYDRGVKLIISAEVAVEELYVGTQLAFVFERTKSRLQEMQSHEYLALEHKA